MTNPDRTPHPRNGTDPPQHRLVKVAAVAVLAMLAYLALSLVGGWSTTLEALRQLGPSQWAILLGLSLLNYGLRFARWHGYLTTLGAQVPILRSLLIYLAGFAFTVTPGKAGEAVRSVYLRADGVPWSPGLAALAAERILDLAAVALLAGLALASFTAYVVPALVLVACVAAGLFVVTHPRVSARVLALLPSVGRWESLKHGVRQTLAHARQLLSANRVTSGLAIGLTAWGAEALGFYLLLGWMGVDTGALAAVGIYSAGMLAGAASFLPGSLGGTEVAMVTLLTASGVIFAVATTATVICRAVTLWFAVGLGIVAALMLWPRRANSETTSDVPHNEAQPPL